jgi:hypothetical protein
MLDEKKIANYPEVSKSVWYAPAKSSVIFGTLYTNWPAGKFKEGIPEDVASLIHCVRENFYSPKLPDGWATDCLWYEDDNRVASFVGYWLSAPLNFEVDEKLKKIPEALWLLLSGHLQLGEDLNFRNYQNYKRRQGLKFLSFVITPTEFRYFIYNPTPERIEKSIGRFQMAINKVGHVGPCLPGIMKDIYALILAERAAEISTRPEFFTELLRAISSKLNWQMASLTGKCGFVYQDHPGPQGAKPFYYSMFTKVPCKKCNDTGTIETGNNDLPCDCPAGETALFNLAGVIGQVAGKEIRRHFLNSSPEPIELGGVDILASSLPGREK